MSIATTMPPAYYAPISSSQRASGALSDQEVWLDETSEGTEATDWRDQHDAALSYVRRLVTFDSPCAAHPTPVITPDRASLSESLRQVYALQSLRAGWNGYDALPPAAESVRHARLWLEAQWRQCQSEGVRWSAPNVTADADGNVVFEWWAEDRTLSLSFVEDAEAASKGRVAEYLKFGRRDGPLAGLREQGAADTAEEAAVLMRWFSE